MSDGPQKCALPGCEEIVEQPDDGGPPRLYCSPAHRVAARKMRHAARMKAAAEKKEAAARAAQQAAADEVTRPIAPPPDAQPAEPPAIAASTDDQPTTELPAAFGGVPQEERAPDPAPDRTSPPAAVGPALPPIPALPSPRTITITSKRVKKPK